MNQETHLDKKQLEEEFTQNEDGAQALQREACPKCEQYYLKIASNFWHEWSGELICKHCYFASQPYFRKPLSLAK